MLVLSLCTPRAYNERNEDLPDNLNSGKSLAEYAVNVIETDCGKKFDIGSVYMIVDSELKGEVEVTLVEKEQKKPMLVYVNFDTKSNKLLDFKYADWHSKLDPGIINIQNWKIDYAEAFEISKEFHSKTDGFRYDDVIIRSYDSYPVADEEKEVWVVSFCDIPGEKNYNTRIDPYTGEVLNHGIWDYSSIAD